MSDSPNQEPVSDQPAAASAEPAATAVTAAVDEAVIAAENARHAHYMEEFAAAREANEAQRKQAEEAAAQLKEIISTVLEAAEVANKTAAAAASSHKLLRESAGNLSSTAKKSSRGGAILVMVGGVLMVVCAGVFAAMAIQLQKKVAQADSLLVKVGTQAIEIRETLSSVDEIGESLQGLGKRDGDLVKSQTELAGRLEAMEKSLAAMQTAAAKKEGDLKKAYDEALKSSQKPDPQLARLLVEVRALDGQVKAQSKALTDASSKVAGITQEVKELQRVGGNVETLKKQIEALVTLERQRYRESLEAASAANKKKQDTPVQFQRRELSDAKP